MWIGRWGARREHGSGTSEGPRVQRLPILQVVRVHPGPPGPRMESSVPMYLVELRPGKEELYRTGDELAAAIRNGDVDMHSRIYHRATSKWISVTLHPQYKAIVAEHTPACLLYTSPSPRD